MVARIAASGVPLDQIDRHALSDSNFELFNAHRVVETLPMSAGGTFDWEFLDPGRWLGTLVDSSPYLQSVFTAAWDRHPCSPLRPWSLAIGFGKRRTHCQQGPHVSDTHMFSWVAVHRW